MIKNDHLSPAPAPLKVGDAAPDFTLPDQHRNPWKLSEALRQGEVALCFFPMAFTEVCSVEMKCITDEMASWKAKGATVVGISTDSFAVLKAWADAQGYKQTLLADMHRQVSKAFGLHWADLNVAQRGTIVIKNDPAGTPRVTFAQARPPGSAMNWQDVLAAL